MDSSFREKLRLVLAFAILAFSGSAAAQSSAAVMPRVTPIASNPIGPAAGGGLQTEVTYEIAAQSAANDAGVAAAANEATYVTRAVTIGGGTIATIARGAISRYFWPIAALTAAVAAYKWYEDSKGTLTKPGTQSPSPPCLAGGGTFTTGGYLENAPHCSVAGAQAAWNAAAAKLHPAPQGDLCVPPGGGGRCFFNYTLTYDDGSSQTLVDSVYWNPGAANDGIVDPEIVTAPQPVSDADLDNQVQQHPETWQPLTHDPNTGNPVITPEIAEDEDNLKHQIAPRYGVDPTTVPTTTPDPNYPTGQAVPQEQNIPQYCQWAAEACNYYKFVEDNWPDADGKKEETDSPDCVTPPSCSGDDVMCGIVRNTWAEKCGVTDVPTDKVEEGSHKVSDLQNPDVDSGDTSKIDQSGFGWSQACPFADFTVTIGQSTGTIPMSPICEFGPWLRAFILMMAGLKAAMIIAGLRDVAK